MFALNLSTARQPLTAQAALRDALAMMDEDSLAHHLRVTVPTLRRYADGSLRMNWVVSTRLAQIAMREALAAPERVVAPRDAYRSTTAARRERRTTRRVPSAVPVVAAV